MKRFYIIISLTFFCLFNNIIAQNQWTWVNGNINLSGVYGIQGVPNNQNIPGRRDDHSSWSDSNGDMWIFGGEGFTPSGAGLLNDLWKYNPTTNQWTWINGSNTANQQSIYGTQGVAANLNNPGARKPSSSWRDNDGNFWLFGGNKRRAGGNDSLSNDLWKYNPSTNQWTWMKGDTIVKQVGVYGVQDVSSNANKPGARERSVSWTDVNGNLWLFGGVGYATINTTWTLLNDLWKYTPSTNQWTWVKGDSIGFQIGVYGQLGISLISNKPGARYGSYSMIDANNNLWLFGGYGYARNSGSFSYLNDLWKYNLISNQWTWVKGDSSNNQTGIYGVQQMPSNANKPGSRLNGISWSDEANGNIWLFGGLGYTGSGNIGWLNDLWKYNLSLNQWTWVKGDSLVDQSTVYGIQGIAADSNKPGGRSSSVPLKDALNNLWLFSGTPGSNDLWKWIPATTGCTTPATQANNISFSSIGTNQITVGWTNGNGNRRIVKINTSNSFTAPANGTDPVANAAYTGGEQVVYNNNGNSVTITGLTAATTYWFRIYEANCSGSSSLYNTTVATNNPLSQITQVVVPLSWIGLYSNDLNHLYLGPPLLLDSANTTQTFPNEVKICADGSKVTVVKYVNRNASIPNSNIRFQIASGPNVDLNGNFNLADYSYSGDTIFARLTHPKFVIPTILDFRPDHIEIVNNINSSVVYQYPIKIYRAPIVFVHGLWGDHSSFENMSDAFFWSVPLMYRVDYKWTNASSFFTNRGVTRFGIDEVLTKARTRKYSAGKAVIIAHSMGGVLARLYLQSTYASPLYRGDISKLITLNTPHLGSQMANWLWDSHPNWISTLNLMMATGTNNGDINAISDLRVNSYPTTHDLNIPLSLQNKVASTTIHTDATGDQSLRAKAVRLLITHNGSTTYLFNGDVNDLIVANNSQDGNLNLFSTLSGQWHVGSPENSAIINGCLGLIDENPTNGIFFTNNGFPPGMLFPPPPDARASTISRVTDDSISILTPISGQTFNAGDSVSITLHTSGNISRTGLIVFGNSISPMSFDTAQSVTLLKFRIPISAIGTLNLWVLAGDSTNWHAADTSHIIVNSSAIPDSIIADPDSISLPVGLTHSVSVHGYFGGNRTNLMGTQGLSFLYDTTYLIYRGGGIFQGKAVGSTNVVFDYAGKKDTVHIDIYDNPSILTAAFAYSRNTVCANSVIQFTDASIGIPVSYHWTFPGGIPSTSTQSNPVVSYSTPGYYLVSLRTTFTNGVDSISIDSLIHVNPLPTATVSAGSATTFCQGGRVILTSSAAIGNQWYKNGVVISDSTGTTLNVTTSGNYTVRVTVNGCTSETSNAIAIIVNSIPSTPTISAATVTTFCSGGSVTLTSNATNGNQWYKDAVLLSGSTGSTLNANTSGSYTVKVTLNGCESGISNAIVVSVNPIPTAPTITSGTTTTFCLGGNVILTSNATIGNQWYKDGVVISGSTATTLNVTTNGSYTAKTTANGCESVSSNIIAVIVNLIPATPTIIQNGNDLISSAASGNQWYLNGAIIAAATGQTYTPTTSGNYTVQVTINNCTSTFSNAINFIVTSLPNIDVFGNQVTVLPNPVKDKLIIIRSGQVLHLNIRLFDIYGKQLKTFTSSLSRIEIDMAKYASGAYIIWVEDKTSKIIGKKMIIKL